MIRNVYTCTLFLLSGLLFSCRDNNADADNGSEAAEVKTPVTVTTVSRQPMTDYIVLNATTAFMTSNMIRSSINGYVESAGIIPGQAVTAGQLLFTLRTKEAHAVGDQAPGAFPEFNGLVKIKAPKNGFVSQLDHQEGDYVQDGEQLCMISDKSSFAILLSAPFELNAALKTGSRCMVLLPDSTQIAGTIQSRIPEVDSVSQTQRYLIRINARRALPENLVVQVRIVRSAKANAAVLPKTAVLTDETQSQWSVMKLVNDSTAVRVPITKGMETDDRVEVLSPTFKPDDRIIVSGNYGLPDTALVTVSR